MISLGWREKKMEKLLRVLKQLIVIVSVSFLIWMNVSPGHFQRTCLCESVRYVTRREVIDLQNGICAAAGVCAPLNPVADLPNQILLLFSTFDLNK